MVVVAACKIRAAGGLSTRIKSTLRPTRSEAIAASLLGSPPVLRETNAICSSRKPAALSPERAAATRGATPDSAPGYKKPIWKIFAYCCARAASGHAVAEPAITLMKSRRRIAFPKAEDYADDHGNYSRVWRCAEWGSVVNLQCKNSEPPTSLLGHFLPIFGLRVRSDCGGLADIGLGILPGGKNCRFHAWHGRAEVW